MRRPRTAVLLGVVMMFAAWEAACAQQPARRSQRGTVTQRVGQTEVAVVYNRPVARGRTLFGELVPWGEVWMPGADTATSVTFDTDVAVNGRPLARGTYSLWTIPGDKSWTVIFNTRHPVWHRPYPGEASDALRVTATPAAGSHMEVLAFYFPVVEPDSAVLALHWGTTVVPITIRPRAAER